MPDGCDDATSEDDQSTEQPEELSCSHHVADVEKIALIESINDKHRAFQTAETATGEFKLAVHIGHVWDVGWSITAFSDFLFEEPDESWWIEQPAILPPSDPDYLCERCRHIDFEWVLSTPTYGSINLGPPEYTLRQKNCSFCQLMACMDLCQHPPIPETLNTAMAWESFDPRGYYNSPKDGLNPIATNESLQVYRMASEKPLEPRILHANGLETPLLGQWIHMCEHQQKPIPSETGLGHILLIDVDDACVVNVPASCRYTALSYRRRSKENTSYITSRTPKCR